MTQSEPLQYGRFYHVYNRGNNRETIFRSAENYRFFLQRYANYVAPVAATYGYCLLPNRFHFLVCVRMEEEQREWHLSLAFVDNLLANLVDQGQGFCFSQPVGGSILGRDPSQTGETLVPGSSVLHVAPVLLKGENHGNRLAVAFDDYRFTAAFAANR